MGSTLTAENDIRGVKPLDHFKSVSCCDFLTSLVEFLTLTTPLLNTRSLVLYRGYRVDWYVEGVCVQATELDSIFPLANAKVTREALTFEL